MKGLIFNIEEFAVFDGPGVRTAIFMKGCPLRCNWCHNPEGFLMRPQRLKAADNCVHCGACEQVCPNEGDPTLCTACGHCAPVCPRGLIRIAGQWMEARALAERLKDNIPLLRMGGGGLTFTGGEALLQADFITEVLEYLPTVHTAVETCGYVQSDVFAAMRERLDLFLFDIKLADDALHKQFTGRSNALILQNLELLKASPKPFIARIPLIPGVSDTSENLSQTARLLTGATNLVRVELLPYNRAAGAKYAQAGLCYAPLFEQDAPVRIDKTPFEQRGMEVFVP